MISPEIIVAAIGAGALLGSPIIQEFSKKLFHSSSPSYDTDGKIDNFVYYLRHKYGCQRLSVYAYHNGGTYYTGKSIDKFTVKHESVSAYTPPLMHVMQGVTTTMLKEIPSIIKHNGILVESNIINTPRVNKPAYFEIMKQYDISSTMVFAVYKNVLKLNKFKYEKEMMYSIHLDWSQDNWIKSISNSASEKTSLIQDIALLSDMLDSKRIQTPDYISNLNTILSESQIK